MSEAFARCDTDDTAGTMTGRPNSILGTLGYGPGLCALLPYEQTLRT